jgi:hypothetical protein
MPLPDNFNSSEHLQSTLIRVFNRIIRDEFSDTGDEPDLNVPRSSLKQACLLNDDDTNTMMLLRLFLFYFGLGKIKELIPVFYGEPIHEIQASRKYQPKVTLIFKESERDAIDRDSRPSWGEISFRLMNETSETLTKQKLTTLANKIRTEFGTGNGFIWNKGKDMATYIETSRGYDFKLLCRTKEHAKAVVNKVLDIQGHSPNWENFNYKENEAKNTAFPVTPPNIRILGKTKKTPVRRPNVDVIFRRADVHIWGLPEPITLISLDTVDPLVF